jgi:hypothetical protein
MNYVRPYIPEAQDPLQEIRQEGTRKLLASAVEPKIQNHLAKHSDSNDEEPIEDKGVVPCY